MTSILLKSDLASELGRATEATLSRQLFEEAAKLEQAFALRRWQHTELDGGRFSEVAARILYGVDSGSYNLTKDLDNCLRYVGNPHLTHAFPSRQSANQLTMILRAIYKLRSQRGAVHVSPTYTANEIDSRLVVEGVRWVLAELLRLFVTSDQASLVAAVEELSRFQHPLIRSYGGRPLVQSTSLTAEEEVLVHLLNERPGMTQAQLVRAIPKDAAGVRRAIKTLASGRVRQIVAVGDHWEIADLGIARIEARLLPANRTV